LPQQRLEFAVSNRVAIVAQTPRAKAQPLPPPPNFFKKILKIQAKQLLPHIYIIQEKIYEKENT
jgi:hypothetical protein